MFQRVISNFHNSLESNSLICWTTLATSACSLGVSAMACDPLPSGRFSGLEDAGLTLTLSSPCLCPLVLRGYLVPRALRCLRDMEMCGV